MRILDSSLSLTRFRARVARAARPQLLLDYDGTLAPFRADRDAAVPWPGVREALHAIRAGGRTALVVVSGRPVADVRRLLAVDVDEIWGAHGHERATAAGSELSPAARAGAAALAGAADALRTAGWGERLEVKPGSLAIHWRGLPPAERDALQRYLRRSGPALAAAAGAELRRFDGGRELRVPGRDKGAVVRDVLRARRDRPVAFLGDDLTDEDAFRALARRGLAVLVRARFRATAARLWIRPPEELLEFLSWWR